MKRITKTEIARMYGISRPTLNKWIESQYELGIDLYQLGYSKDNRLLSPAMLEKIIEYLGEPLYPLGNAPQEIEDKSTPSTDENNSE
jgi:transposase